MRPLQSATNSHVPSYWILKSLRWIARISGALLGVLILVIAIGEGGFPLNRPFPETILTILFICTTIGLFVGWRFDFLGGILVIVGMGGFYLFHYWNSDCTRWPGGWVFPCLYLPGFLYLLSALLKHCLRPHISP